VNSLQPGLGDNPFATCRTRPGTLPFLFEAGQCDAHSLDELVARWIAHRRRGAVVGPHGSGKSTLLAALLPVLRRSGLPLVHVELHDGQRCLPSDAWARVGADTDCVLVIDGYEQLSWLQRLRLAAWSRLGGGLLITSHLPTWLPTICLLQPSLAAAQAIVRALQADQLEVITPSDVAAAFADHRGDLREMLFALYDLYESRHPT